MKSTIYQQIQKTAAAGKKQFWVLLDPDRESPDMLREASGLAAENGVDGLLVGSSILKNNHFDESVLAVKEGCGSKLPVIIFPGCHRQVSRHADAMLFHVLLSSRNAQYLVEEQYLAADEISKIGLETIPTGYILIDSGNVTSVQRKTGTSPLDRNDIEAIANHALTGQFLGKQLTYLEAGSGARWSVPPEAIRLTREKTQVPLVVGGGIRTPDEASEVALSGADFIVVGNALEEKRSALFVQEMADAVHGQIKVSS